MARILVAGVGNIVMGDDGMGVYALQALNNQELPDHVDTVEAGTALLDALPELAPYSKLILLDAVQNENDGVCVVRDPLATSSPAPGFSLHDIGITEALSMIRLEQGDLPEVVIIGVRPRNTEFGTQLSTAVETAIPTIVSAVTREINQTQLHNTCVHGYTDKEA